MNLKTHGTQTYLCNDYVYHSWTEMIFQNIRIWRLNKMIYFEYGNINSALINLQTSHSWYLRRLLLWPRYRMKSEPHLKLQFVSLQAFKKSAIVKVQGLWIKKSKDSEVLVISIAHFLCY